jgi:hypothetical protein
MAGYLEVLVELEPDALKAATKRTISEWDRPSMMPPIKFILERTGVNPTLLSEQAWDWIQVYVRKHWHVDIGHFQGAPQIPPATDYAVRQVGGLARIAYRSDRDTDFVRKGFLDAHQRFTAEDGEQLKLSHADASKLLDTLRISRDSGTLPTNALTEKTGE